MSDHPPQLGPYDFMPCKEVAWSDILYNIDGLLLFTKVLYFC